MQILVENAASRICLVQCMIDPCNLNACRNRQKPQMYTLHFYNLECRVAYGIAKASPCCLPQVCRGHI